MNITGNDFGNTLEGTPQDDLIKGLLGNDEITGGLGNDIIIGGPEDPVPGFTDNDRLFGDTNRSEAGNDVVSGGYGNDLIYGDSFDWALGGVGGNDTLFGGTGNDTLVGGFGNDFMEGEDGNDFLDGGPGADQMIGGNGNDTYTVDHTADIVTEDASQGNDTVISTISYTLGANVENLTLSGSTTINGTGNNLDNVITGNAFNNVIAGADGNDTLSGGLGNDTLTGGAGNDYINGYGSKLTNDSQFDRLTGGSGSDTFVLGETGKVFYNETGDGYAVIQDWDPKASSTDTGFDRIQLAGNVNQYKVEFSSVSGIGTSAKDASISFKTNGTWERVGIIQDSTNFNFGRDAVFV